MNNKVFFIGCLHFGDNQLVNNTDGIRKLDSQEHDELIINNWNKTVSNYDTVYILGDVTNEDTEPYHLLTRLNGKKFIVLGNHDLMISYNSDDWKTENILNYVDGVCGMKYLEIDGYKLWLTHAPLHPQELMHVDFNIHAHIHNMFIPYTEVRTHYWTKSGVIKSKSKLGYINVDSELLKYTPHTLEDLIKLGNEKVEISNFS